MLVALLAVVLASPSDRPEITRVWLTHRTPSPTHLVISWQSPSPGASVVTYRVDGGPPRTARAEGRSTLHHVEIPLVTHPAVYRYVVSTGGQRSAEATFRSYGGPVLRVAVLANWHRRPPLDALVRDDVHLLTTAGDNVTNLHGACGEAVVDCLEAYGALIDAYPALFRSTPFMPALGNHDREVRKRGAAPAPLPTYDVDAVAFRRFFALPDPGWRWDFRVPGFSVRLAALDLAHVADHGTTWQACHAFDAASEQLRWYRQLTAGAREDFLVTLYNEGNARTRGLAAGAWRGLLARATVNVSGYGHFGERAEAGGALYYNTSLYGRGTPLRDPAGKAYFAEDNYVLLTFVRGATYATVELKRLRDGAVLDVRRLAARRRS